MMRIPVSAVPDIRDFLSKRKNASHIRIAPLESIRMWGDYARVDAANRATIPLVGSRVAAGFPSPADDYIEEHLDLNELLAPARESTFMVRVKKESESMIEAGIFPGDLLVVDRAKKAVHGSYVIAILDGDLTVKQLYEKDGKVGLIPRNKAMRPIFLREGQELQIWGVVTSCTHQFNT